LLRRHVGGRAHHVTGAGDADVALGGHAKVHDFGRNVLERAERLVRAAQEDVARLDVTVKHAGGVGSDQRFADLDTQIGCLLDAERIAALTLRQIFAVQPLHRYVGQAALFEHAVGNGLDDAGVVEVLEQLALAHQALLLFGRDTGVGRDHLERDRPLRGQVEGPIHDAYPTSAYLALHHESPAKAPALGVGRLFHE
jgi:NAD(P)-dependent dehydrogenase (short-subunit alcohol dehydrogenase family)